MFVARVRESAENGQLDLAAVRDAALRERQVAAREWATRLLEDVAA